LHGSPRHARPGRGGRREARGRVEPVRDEGARQRAGPRDRGRGLSPIRVAVAEDSLLVREGIVRILDEAEGIEVVGAAGNADALRALVDRAEPDAVVTDIRMPPTHTDEGIRLACGLATSHPDLAVVVLSQHAEPSYALALFEPGSS